MEMQKTEKIFVNNPIFNYLHNKFLVERFLKNISDNPKSILEVGCGIGYTTKAISKKFPNSKITAMDYDKGQIRLAALLLPLLSQLQ